MLPVTHITGRSTSWKDMPLIKSRLGGYCLRNATPGSAYANICEHCPNFRTDAFLPVLAAQRADAQALLAGAEARDRGEEAARYRCLLERLDQHMTQTEASCAPRS